MGLLSMLVHSKERRPDAVITGRDPREPLWSPCRALCPRESLCSTCRASCPAESGFRVWSVCWAPCWAPGWAPCWAPCWMLLLDTCLFSGTLSISLAVLVLAGGMCLTSLEIANVPGCTTLPPRMRVLVCA
eukprot:2474446-Pyramimonas_sp.AAC.2